MSRQAAARFSFLLAVPVTAAAGLSRDQRLRRAAVPLDTRALVLGVVVSAVTGFASIHYLLKWLTRFGMLPYVIYRLGLGACAPAVAAIACWHRGSATAANDRRRACREFSRSTRRVGTSARSSRSCSSTRCCSRLSPYLAGWALVLEFIFTLAMALRCYPLQPGGLLALEAVAIGMTSPTAVYDETVAGIEVVLLLIFMVAGIFFLKQLLLFAFTKRAAEGALEARCCRCYSAASRPCLSAFLDALTVTAVVITAAAGFYGVYHKAASGKHYQHADHDPSNDDAGSRAASPKISSSFARSCAASSCTPPSAPRSAA